MAAYALACAASESFMDFTAQSGTINRVVIEHFGHFSRHLRSEPNKLSDG